jgi:hypothetical protein
VVGAHEASAQGGAVFEAVDHATVSGSTFSGNQVAATAPGGDAHAHGGGLFADTGSLRVLASHFTRNRASASASGAVVAGGGGLFDVGVLHVQGSSFSLSTVVAQSDTGPAHAGGAGVGTSFEPLSILRSTFDRNRLAAATDTGSSGVAGGGLSSSGPATIVASTVSRNTMTATSEGPGTLATGLGGGLFLDGPTVEGTIRNSTLAGNTGSATSPGGTGSTQAEGGGIYSALNSLEITSSTVARNSIAGAGQLLTVHGGGVAHFSGKPVTIEGTILALNTAASGPDCFPDVTSAGNNLLGSTGACMFGPLAHDKSHVNPKLGALANNGGPTRTLALLLGSPALNWIPAADCAVAKDQRGVARPQPANGKCDIGAYERRP